MENLEKLYDLNEEQLELVTHLVNRWVIEIEDGYTWAREQLPEGLREDMIDELDKAKELAISVQELFNDD